VTLTSLFFVESWADATTPIEKNKADKMEYFIDKVLVVICKI